MKRKIESLIGLFRQEIKRASGEAPNKEQIKNMATEAEARY